MQLAVKDRQYLKKLAHELNPVVIIGNNGLTGSVIKEIKLNLTAHELIKIKLLSDEREERLALVAPILQATEALLVQQIGKLLVLYRPSPAAKISLPQPKA